MNIHTDKDTIIDNHINIDTDRKGQDYGDRRERRNITQRQTDK